MGQLTSTLSSSFNFWNNSANKNCNFTDNISNSNVKNWSITPYVYTRTGSMYFDEDGDLAHEFFEEIKTRKGIKMKKTSKDKLKPQGCVKLLIPRLNKDIPIIIHEIKS